MGSWNFGVQETVKLVHYLTEIKNMEEAKYNTDHILYKNNM